MPWKKENQESQNTGSYSNSQDDSNTASTRTQKMSYSKMSAAHEETKNQGKEEQSQKTIYP